VGTTQVKAGNLVGRGESTLLTTVSQVDPILFRAGVSEAEYLKVAKRILEEGGLKATRQRAEVDLILADGTVHRHKGFIDTIERAVDPTTGTLAIQFTFPNPERLVRPGQYGRVRGVNERKKGALLVPQRAVIELQNLYSLAVVGAGNKVEFRNVKVGPRVDSLWLIEEGLKPGEKVVVEGLQKVRDGMVVSPKAAAAAPAGKGASEPATEAK
jgi:membrane fusion protein (multidrug efflux system)